MFDLYHKSQEAQLRWIRNHPVKYVALNVVVLAVGLGIAKLYDRRAECKFNEKMNQQG